MKKLGFVAFVTVGLAAQPPTYDLINQRGLEEYDFAVVASCAPDPTRNGLVNGVPVIRDGKITDARHGRVLRGPGGGKSS